MQLFNNNTNWTFFFFFFHVLRPNRILKHTVLACTSLGRVYRFRTIFSGRRETEEFKINNSVGVYVLVYRAMACVRL